ncbi:hypothetical protein HNY73_019114 [Argiope bruennichi]|uniref:Uncharacterized protein n=1 Tax=Argiope bruennichi TaxID=94029 RepID=A0A8T0EJC5_ARGBR|nr:hypothetical protein HNY73_019114 [Argiope bruennichi]
MASLSQLPCPKVDPEVSRSVTRFVYDVMMYTLPKCGLPDSRLPTTDVRNNVYRRPNLVNIAGVSALRVSLIMRDKWKRMFESRRKTSLLDDKQLPTFLVNIVLCCPLSRDCTKQTMVEVLLAVCNEITVYFHSANVDFSINTVLGSIGFAIVNIIGSPTNFLQEIEELFDKFDNLEEYTKWITEFIAKFAVPYGSRDDVSDLFFEEVKKQHFNEIKKVKAVAKPKPKPKSKAKSKAKAQPEPEDPSIKKLKDHLGFLPHDLFSAIVAEESVSLPENLMLPSGSALPGDRDSPEPPILPPSTKSGAIEKRKSRNRRSSRSSKTSEESGPLASASGPVWRNEPPKSHASSESGAASEKKSGEKEATRSRKASEQVAQGQQSDKDSTQMRLEDELKRLSLGTERTSQGSQGAIPKKKGSKK